MICSVEKATRLTVNRSGDELIYTLSPTVISPTLQRFKTKVSQAFVD